jgi:membrane fusion protein (multidrug efflux system)
MRKLITSIIAVIILAGGFFYAKELSNRERRQRPAPKKALTTVYFEKVQNGSVPVYIEESGRLSSKHVIEVYSEVTGVMESSRKEFKPGTTYRKGEVLVKVRANDYYANLQAQKSVLQNLITSVLPDLRLDYPEAYPRWDAYLKNFDMNKPIQELPKPGSDKEKFFITGKNIYTTFYNTKNLEIVLQKYTIRAPFNGILTEALVTPGTVVRPGQKLGEFIDPTIYELELSISQTFLPDLVLNKQVQVFDTENNEQSWTGKIARINGKVNPTTQTVQVFVELSGDGLREGMFLKAIIDAKPKENSVEVPRNMLVNDNRMYVLQDSSLVLTDVEVLYRTNETAIVSGLENGVDLVIKPVPGGYAGMKVKPVQNK